LRCATFSIAWKAATVSPRNNAAVRLSLKDRITKETYNISHYM
jgi:hypothetical protein